MPLASTMQAHRRGGKDDESNLVTACCKCNALKSDAESKEFQEKLRRRTVKDKYGEPVHWDGLSTLFVILAECSPDILTKNEREWLQVFKRSTSPTLFSTTPVAAQAVSST